MNDGLADSRQLKIETLRRRARLTTTNVLLVVRPGWKNTITATAATLINQSAHKREKDQRFVNVHQRFVVKRAKRAPMSGAPRPRMKKAMRVCVSLGVNPVAKESGKSMKPSSTKRGGIAIPSGPCAGKVRLRHDHALDQQDTPGIIVSSTIQILVGILRGVSSHELQTLFKYIRRQSETKPHELLMSHQLRCQCSLS